MYQEQDGCSVTTGGSKYHMVSGPDEFLVGKPNSEAVTTPVFTLFYNEPWKASTTGPAPFLVHMTCLRIVPSASRAIRVHFDAGIFLAMLLVACGWPWILVAW
jgi:hypothetical protein